MNFGRYKFCVDYDAENRLSLSFMVLEKKRQTFPSVKMKGTSILLLKSSLSVFRIKNYLVNYIIIIEIDKTKAAFLSCLLIDQHFDALDFSIAIKVRLVLGRFSIGPTSKSNPLRPSR